MSFFFQAEDGIRDTSVTGVQTCALPISSNPAAMDLLSVQQPGMTLDKLASEMSVRLRIPYLHIVYIVEQYKRFKRREIGRASCRESDKKPDRAVYVS